MGRVLTWTMTSIFLLAGCATAPKSADERQQLVVQANDTVEWMATKDPDLREVLSRAPAYIVFPEVAKGGALVGGAYGRGVLFEDGAPTGYAELNQASLGALLGGKTFAQLVVLHRGASVELLRGGGLTFGGDVSGVVLKAGASRSASFGDRPVSVFVADRGGLMVDISVSGQEIDYLPADR